jgi:hypothetical protein
MEIDRDRSRATAAGHGRIGRIVVRGEFGPLHLSNFGAYASPERRLVFDLNDFDETLPGPFEWDVKRLAASLVVAGRDNGFTAKQSRRTTLAAVETYRTAMRGFAAQPILDVWYAHLNIEDAVAEDRSTLTARKLKEQKADIKATERLLAKARTRDSLQAVGKLTTVVDGMRRIVSDPPLVVPIDEPSGFDHEVLLERIRGVLAAYRGTLPPDRRWLLDQFTLADAAHKVVGVGSVGTRAWIFLLKGDVEGEALLLQRHRRLRRDLRRPERTRPCRAPGRRRRRTRPGAVRGMNRLDQPRPGPRLDADVSEGGRGCSTSSGRSSRG